jgi:RNA polymerase sigma factor (TIGR02999 family)
MMRQILVDHARARNYQKRGGDAVRVTADDLAKASESKSGEMIALDDALTQLAVHYPRQSEVVELRFFGGLSVEETALVLQVSPPTVVRDWSFARAWLSSYMKGELPPI